MEQDKKTVNINLQGNVDCSNLQNLNMKEKTSRKLEKESSALSIFQAQEKNKKNVCKQSFKKLWGKQTAEVKDQNQDEKKQKPEYRDALIRKYAYLVNWIVNRLPVTSLKGMDREDLIGYGTIGLIEAVDRFDPSRNINFESFATARVRGSIYDHLRASDWLTRGSRKRVKNLLKAASELENSLGRCPNDKELAKELLISVEELRIIQQESQIGIFSLDEPRDSYSDTNSTLIDSISSNSSTLLEELEENELKEQLTKAVDTLPEREKTVIGLYHYKKLTFKEIAEVMDFSESRASQLHARAISLLKSKMLKD